MAGVYRRKTGYTESMENIAIKWAERRTGCVSRPVSAIFAERKAWLSSGVLRPARKGEIVAVRGGQRAKCTLLHGHVLRDLLRKDCLGSSGRCLAGMQGKLKGQEENNPPHRRKAACGCSTATEHREGAYQFIPGDSQADLKDPPPGPDPEVRPGQRRFETETKMAEF